MVYKLANLTFLGVGIHFFPDALVHVILKINTLVDLLICHLSVYFITPAIVPKRMDRKSFLPYISSVQSLSPVWLFATPWTTAHQASLSITNSQSPSKPISIESVMPSNHLILCHSLLLLPSIFPSIRVFSNESALCMRWPKYWSFSFNISPSNEHPQLISFRMDWLDLLAVQGTLKSLLQHHSSNASILWRSAFFTVQLSHPYMTTGKTIALTRRTFVGKMSLLPYWSCLNIQPPSAYSALPNNKSLLRIDTFTGRQTNLNSGTSWQA